MANYSITKHADPTTITINDGTLNTDFTLPFVGQNYVGFGQTFAQNQLRMLEHFAGDVAPDNAVRGQLWYHIDTGDTIGILKAWTGADPSDISYNPLTDSSGLIANVASWVEVGPENISGGNIGTLLDPYNNIYCTNIYAANSGEFLTLFVGASGNGLTASEFSFLPTPDSTANNIGVYLGDSTHRFRESHVRNEFIYGSLNIGTFTSNKNVKLIVDAAQDYTLLPDPAQTVHLGMSTVSTKRFESVNSKLVDTTNINVGTGAGQGLGTDLNPKTNVTYNLGSSSYKYNNVYADKVNVETVKRNSATAKVGESGSPFLEMHATTFYGTATQAQYADLAERYEADEHYEYGTVVKFGGEKEITKTTVEGEFVFGVISNLPAYMMNAAAGNNQTHPYVALAGRVPVKVYGLAKKHQLLISSDMPGVAIAVDQQDVDDIRRIVGRVLSNKDTLDIGYVEAAVGVR